MNRLVLIDGNAILHRAYHALPPLTAPDGTLVNAVYGFTTMLFKIFHDLAPSHIAVCFDRPKPTFRKKMFADYQAKRPKMDEELVGQIEKVHEVITAFGIPIVEKDGFEADDLIGTLCRLATSNKKQATSKNIQKNVSHVPCSMSPPVDQVIIVTGDKDILQLVNDHTYVYMPTKGLSEAKLYMENDVQDRLGVTPEHIPDYKGLAGDPSDNYPGVVGIGPKTAATLLSTFGSIEDLYSALKKNDTRILQFSPSIREKLTKGEESAKLSKDLATIRTNVALETTIHTSHISTLDTPKARKVLGDLHFHSLLKRLEPKKEPKAKEAKKRDTVKTSQQQELF
jgi:5'-3' exonuclease